MHLQRVGQSRTCTPYTWLFSCQKYRIYIVYTGLGLGFGYFPAKNTVYIFFFLAKPMHVAYCMMVLVYMWQRFSMFLHVYICGCQRTSSFSNIVCSVSKMCILCTKKPMSTISLCVQSASFCTRCTKKSMNTVLLCVESVLVYTLYKKKSLNTVSLVVQSASLCLLVSIDFV